MKFRKSMRLIKRSLSWCHKKATSILTFIPEIIWKLFKNTDSKEIDTLQHNKVNQSREF